MEEAFSVRKMSATMNEGGVRILRAKKAGYEVHTERYY